MKRLACRMWWGFWFTVALLFEDYKLARRAALFWCMWMISTVLLRATQPEVLVALGGAGSATIVTGATGLLATVIGFYIASRKRDDDNPEDSSRLGFRRFSRWFGMARRKQDPEPSGDDRNP